MSGWTATGRTNERDRIMTKKAFESYRQGDVLLIKVDDAPKGAAVPLDAGRVVLAYGEVTGHAHAIASRSATLHERLLTEDRTADGNDIWRAAERILVASAPVALQHEEHATIDLPGGTFRVVRQREFDALSSRLVAD